MQAIDNVTRRSVLYATAAGLVALSSRAATAHPMPDTIITVSRLPTHMRLTIRAPVDDLRLSLDTRLSTPLRLDQQVRQTLQSYFANHMRVIRSDGAPVLFSIDSMSVSYEANHDVGEYEELELSASAPVEIQDRLVLDYDAIMHHRAIVADTSGLELGVIRYSLSQKRATPVALPTP